MQRYRQHLPMLTDCKALVNVRTCGTIIAADVCEPADGYLHPLRDQLYQRALKEGVLLRPLGNTLYLLPPYPTPLELIDRTLALFCRLAEEQQLVPNAPGR
jgi:adenosylmethionine-8-amino-7-oxononanoate aminotransferase